jgi:hypothetical protein
VGENPTIKRQEGTGLGKRFKKNTSYTRSRGGRSGKSDPVLTVEANGPSRAISNAVQYDGTFSSFIKSGNNGFGAATSPVRLIINACYPADAFFGVNGSRGNVNAAFAAVIKTAYAAYSYQSGNDKWQEEALNNIVTITCMFVPIIVWLRAKRRLEAYCPGATRAATAATDSIYPPHFDTWQNLQSFIKKTPIPVPVLAVKIAELFDVALQMSGPVPDNAKPPPIFMPFTAYNNISSVITDLEYCMSLQKGAIMANLLRLRMVNLEEVGHPSPLMDIDSDIGDFLCQHTPMRFRNSANNADVHYTSHWNGQTDIEFNQWYGLPMLLDAAPFYTSDQSTRTNYKALTVLLDAAGVAAVAKCSSVFVYIEGVQTPTRLLYDVASYEGLQLLGPWAVQNALVRQRPQKFQTLSDPVSSEAVWELKVQSWLINRLTGGSIGCIGRTPLPDSRTVVINCRMGISGQLSSIRNEMAQLGGDTSPPAPKMVGHDYEQHGAPGVSSDFASAEEEARDRA